MPTENLTHQYNQKAANLCSRLDRLPITRTNIRIAFLLTLVWLCEAFDVGIMGGVIIMVKDMWELTPRDIGLLGVCSTAGIAVGSLFAGRMMDVYGRKKVIIVGVILFSILTAACAAIADIRWMIACRFLAGIGIGAVFPIPAIMMAEFVGNKWRATLIGIAGGLLILAYGLPNLLNSWIVQNFPVETAWRVPFILGGIPLVMVIFLVLWLPETPRWLIQQGRIKEVEALVKKLENEASIAHDDQWVNPGILKSMTSSQSEIKGSMGMLLKRPYLGRIVVTCLVSLGGVTAVYALGVYTPMILSTKVASSAEALRYSALVAVFGFLGALFVGRLSDLWGRRPLFIVYNFIAALGFAAAAQSATVFVLLLGVYAGALGGIGIGPLGRTYIAEQVPTQLRGTAAATTEAVLRILGGVLIAFFIPFIFDAGGVKGVFWMVTAGFVIFTIPFILWGRETAGMSVEEASSVAEPAGVQELNTGLN